MKQKQAPQKRPDGTLNALVKTLGIGKRRISELLSDGMPDDPQGALAWRAARENDDSAAELRRQRITLVREQARLARAAADEKEGRMISRELVTSREVGIATVLQAFLRRLESELPGLLNGLPLERARPLTKEYVRKIQATLYDEIEKFWNDHPAIKATETTEKP